VKDADLALAGGDDLTVAFLDVGRFPHQPLGHFSLAPMRGCGKVPDRAVPGNGGVEAPVHGWSVDFSLRSGHADRKQNKTLGRETP
jgi:hypothetical protein